MEDCNCPPPHQVFRETMGTKEDCPVHPTPKDLGDLLQPLITDMRPISFGPVVR